MDAHGDDRAAHEVDDLVVFLPLDTNVSVDSAHDADARRGLGDGVEQLNLRTVQIVDVPSTVLSNKPVFIEQFFETASLALPTSGSKSLVSFEVVGVETPRRTRGIFPVQPSRKCGCVTAWHRRKILAR